MKKIFLCVILFVFSHTAFAQTKIDEYGPETISDDELARIDYIHTIIAKESESKAYFVVHKPKSMPLGKFLRRFYGVQRMWAHWSQFNPKLMEMVAGEETEKILTQIWAIAKGGKLPDVKTISLEDKLKGIITKKTLFDYDCMECIDDPPRNLAIFYDGLKFYAEALKANPKARALILLGRNYQIKNTRNKLIKDFGIQPKRIKIQIRRSLPIYSDIQFYIIPAN